MDAFEQLRDIAAPLFGAKLGTLTSMEFPSTVKFPWVLTLAVISVLPAARPPLALIPSPAPLELTTKFDWPVTLTSTLPAVPVPPPFDSNAICPVVLN